MKIKPLLVDRIQTQHTSFVVDLKLDNNITFITGDSGIGKSLVFSIIREEAVSDKRIRSFNYLDEHNSYKTAIKNSKGKLFIIDNSDLLLDDDLRHYIAFDASNQYIIIGHNPYGLFLNYNEIYELESKKENDKTIFTISKCHL